MRRMSFLYLAIAAVFPLQLFAGAGDNLAKFTVSQPTMVPGTTLQPGSYTIRIVDHLQDRVIVRIDQAGVSQATFIGVPTPGLAGAGRSGLVSWGTAPAGEAAVRGYTFSGTAPIEFVYPKDDAVALAKLNDGKVDAVDPASEGKAAQVSSLSKEEMQMVTLWMLTPTKVGPNDAAGPQIKAEKLVLVAAATPRKPLLARLPHTASLYPAVLLIGLLSAFSATFLRLQRVTPKSSVEKSSV